MKEIALRTLLFYWNLPLQIKKLFLPLVKIFVGMLAGNPVFADLRDLEKECRQFGIEPTPAVLDDIRSCWILYGARPKEYFLYGFRDMDDSERNTYLTDHYREQVLKKVIGLRFFKDELINKIGFYQRNSRFFHRKCFFMTTATTFSEFRAFVQEAGKVFIKDNRGSFGSKGRIIAFESEEQLKSDFRKMLSDSPEWIVEELIVQDEGLSCWNQSSVNTIRIPSYLTRKGIRIFRPFIRTGRAGSCVDNAGVGGIFATIDEQTGKIVTRGADESGNFYDCHPDSKITFLGWQVPRWDELLAVAREAHLQMSDHKYIAYDFALTPSGWVMVEGNWGQYMCQQTSLRKGQKKGFLELMRN